MVAQRVVMVVDMQNGVFATPRHQRAVRRADQSADGGGRDRDLYPACRSGRAGGGE